MNDNETIPVASAVQRVKDFQVTVQQKVPVERVKDLLCGAIEGGSNYWCQFCDRMGGIPQAKAEYRQDVPFAEGGWLRVIEYEPGMPKDANIPARYTTTIDKTKVEAYRLDMEAITRGIQVFAEKYPGHFGDFMAENEDATTSDVFLQCCLFGEAIYG
jgi:hypothetical protein